MKAPWLVLALLVVIARAQDEAAAAEAAAEERAEAEAEEAAAEERAEAEAAAAEKEPTCEEAAAAGMEPTCECVCKLDRGIGSGDCITNCRTSTSVEDFVTEETQYGGAGQGGEEMEEYLEEATGEEIDECIPTVNPDEEPTFKETDLNGDGLIEYDEEFIPLAEAMCIPGLVAEDLFLTADLNQDNVVDKHEWDELGEDTEMEHAVDETVDAHGVSTDSYDEVQLPPFDIFDQSPKDGLLEEQELEDLLVAELEKLGLSDEEIQEKAGTVMEELWEALEGEEVDANEDVAISKTEYDRERVGHHMGVVAREASDHAAENKRDVDDETKEEYSQATAGPGVFAAVRRYRLRAGRANAHRLQNLLARRGARQLRGRRSQKMTRKRAEGALRKFRALANVKHLRQHLLRAARRQQGLGALLKKLRATKQRHVLDLQQIKRRHVHGH